MWTALLILISTVGSAAVDLSGRWLLEFQREEDSAVYVADCVWEQDGTRLTGGCTSGFDSIAEVSGKVTEAEITFTLAYDTERARNAMEFSAQLSRADLVRGTWRLASARGAGGRGTFTATKR